MTREKEIQILIDGKNKWKGKKTMATNLSNIFINQSKDPKNELIADNLTNIAYRLANCGSFLEFSPTVSGDKKLVNANFCKVRLCPMCNWRRSKKIFGQVSKIIKAINNDKEKEYIFLTLTCKNVPSEDLRNKIKELLKSFNRMISDNSKIKKMCKGYFRALEVTRNNNGTYHPHLHIIICVNKSYFTSRDYIKQKEWCEIWQHYLKIDYDPVVHIEKFKSSNHKSIAEASKYAVKDTDLFLKSQEETDKNIMTLYQALHNVRLIGMGGIFKEYHKKLNLDDANADDVDLIKTYNEENEDNKIIKDIVLRYEWSVGYKNYVLVEEKKK